MHFAFSLNHISILDMGAVAYSSTPVDLVFLLINEDFLILHVLLPKNARNGMNTPTGAWTNPKNFDLNKNFNMNLI